MKPERILVVSPNWLGDAVMAMPALRRLARERPAARISVLSRPAFAPLWRAVEGVADVLPLPKAESATFRAARRLRAEGFSEALLLPNSFRSAVAPFLARIPRRRGTADLLRRPLLTDPVRFSAGEARLHQSLEYAKILCGSPACDLSDTGFRIGAPEPALAALLPDGPGPLVGIVPGAARGPSKRWPRFAEAAALVAAARPDVRFAVFGGRGEEGTCAEVAASLGAPDLCGRTDLPQFAALLGACDAVLCNDSGGMHLASALGVPVVAVFGVTDPEKTGPVGPRAVVVRAEGVKAARAVRRDDPAAVSALLSVPAARVADALLGLLPAPTPFPASFPAESGRARSPRAPRLT